LAQETAPKTASTRAERIAAAERRLAAVQLPFQSIKAEYDAASQELSRAVTGFFPGDRVQVTVTCDRGCCIENTYTGVVIETNANGTLQIQADDGGALYKYVSTYDVTRLG
jgi:hypothetical protein